MGDRSLPEPTEFVIWAAVALLATIVGVGVAFGAWMALRLSATPLVAEAAIALTSIGLALVGMAVERPLYRAFVVIFALALMAAYLLGGPQFARLLG